MTKKETFKWIVQIIASIATAILTAMATGAGICDKALTRRQNRVAKLSHKKEKRAVRPAFYFVDMKIVA